MSRNSKISILLLLGILSLVSFSFSLLFSSTINASQTSADLYVSPTAQGSGDCSSWENACRLETALNTAVSGNEIWVQQGIHYPTTDTSNITATFTLTDGVAVYGGFAGSETSQDQRDFNTNVAVLSGDLGQDDAILSGLNIVGEQSGENSYHVVTSSGVTTTAVLDGFVITGGQADGGTAYDNGAGIYNDDGSPTLRNLTIGGNSANSGGAGMLNANGASPTVMYVKFISNTAQSGAGMLNVNNSAPELTHVDFSYNAAEDDGGGMYNLTGSNPSFAHVSFFGNTADRGGGIFNDRTASTYNNVIFRGNTGRESGGGIYSTEVSQLTFFNALFSGNQAGIGGAMLTADSAITLTNSTISGNQASETAGGLYNLITDVTLVNTILWGNQDNTGSGTLTATINNDTSFVNINNSIIQESGGSSDWNSNAGIDNGQNLDEDPLFVFEIDPAIAPTTAGGFALQMASPAIDAGNTLSYTNSTSTTVDLAGSVRVQDTIDIGAYEGSIPIFMPHLSISE